MYKSHGWLVQCTWPWRRIFNGLDYKRLEYHTVTMDRRRLAIICSKRWSRRTLSWQLGKSSKRLTSATNVLKRYLLCLLALVVKQCDRPASSPSSARSIEHAQSIHPSAYLQGAYPLLAVLRTLALTLEFFTLPIISSKLATGGVTYPQGWVIKKVPQSCSGTVGSEFPWVFPWENPIVQSPNKVKRCESKGQTKKSVPFNLQVFTCSTCTCTIHIKGYSKCHTPQGVSTTTSAQFGIILE